MGSRVMLICSHCNAKVISSVKFVGKPHLGCRENGEWILDTSFSRPVTAQPLDITDELPKQMPEKQPLPTEEIKIRMLKNVRPDFLFGIVSGKPGTILRCGMEYQGITNKNGAISGICENGELLGVKPGEFEFVEAPEWVLKIWGIRIIV